MIESPSQHAGVVGGTSAWTVADVCDDRSWLHVLDTRQVDALLDAARRWDGLDHLRLDAAAVRDALAPLRPVVAQAIDALAGRGFAMVRGVPVDDLSPRQIQAVYWAIGMLFGKGLTQNAQAEFLCPVTDRGVDFGYAGKSSQLNVRGYQSKADLNHHCDPTDVVALLCVRKASSGGLSSIVSTAAIHDEILRRHPEHLPVLMRGFPYDRKAEQWPGESEITERIPVFVRHADRVSCRYARSYILGAAQKTVPLDEREIAALDCFDAMTRRPDLALRIAFEPGDIQLLNNFAIVHGRTAYEDDPDPARRRFLWRLWLDLGARPPWCDEDPVMRWAFARFGNLGRSVDEWDRLRAAGVAKAVEG